MIHNFQSEKFRNYIRKSFIPIVDPNKFAGQMQYKDSKLCIQHLEEILSNPLFSFHKKEILDFDPIKYLDRLITQIDYKDENKLNYILEINHFLKFYEKNQPYIFIQTKFNANSINLPLHELSLLAIQKKIPLQIEHFTTSVSRQIQFVQTVIDSHVKNIGTTLPIWGEILGYSFYYSEQLTIEFNARGQQIITEEIY